MNSLLSETSADPSINYSYLDFLAQAVEAANLQIEPKKAAQPRSQQIILKGGEREHDDNCWDSLKCTIQWELAKIQRKRTYDRQHQEIKTLKRKLGEVTIPNETWKKKLSDITEENTNQLTENNIKATE